MLAADAAHQVTGVEPGIPLLEHITEDRRFALGRVGVTVEGPLGADLADQETRFAPGHFLEETAVVAQGTVVLQVVADDGEGGRGEAHRIVEIEHVGEADIAFAGGVELHHPLDAEARLELRPDGRAQAVADHAGQAVAPFLGAGRLVQQVAAELADVTEAGGLVVRHVLPEVAGGELAAQGDGGAAGQHRGPAHGHRVVVVAGQGQVEDVALGEGETGVAEAAIGLDPFAVAEDGGLGQARGAGGVDVEAGVLEAYLAGLRRILDGVAEGNAHQVLPAGRGVTGGGQAVTVGDPVAVSGILQLAADFLEGTPQLVAHHEVTGLDQVQAVAQHLAALGGVHQGGDGPQFGQGPQHRQHFDAVLQHHRHHAAMLHAFGLQGVGQAVAPGVELGVAEAALLIDHRRALRVQARRTLQGPAQGQCLLAVANAGVVEAQHHARQAGQVARQAGDETQRGDQFCLAHGSRVLSLLYAGMASL
ncbi:hypothetical protein FQZ97_717550 [compost metagenome]